MYHLHIFNIIIYFNEYLGNNYKFLEQSKHWVSWHSTHKLDNELMPKPFLNVPQSFVVLAFSSPSLHLMNVPFTGSVHWSTGHLAHAIASAIPHFSHLNVYVLNSKFKNALIKVCIWIVSVHSSVVWSIPLRNFYIHVLLNQILLYWHKHIFKNDIVDNFLDIL